MVGWRGEREVKVVVEKSEVMDKGEAAAGGER